MYSRNIQLPTEKSFFLFGPRATGKTTLIKTRYPNTLYLDLLNSELYQSLLANPGRLQELIPPNFNNYIVLDEVQRVPELLNEVHRAIENPRHYRFILTGSSARKLRRHGHNLLAGRALTYYLHPLSAAELGANFDLKNALRYGTLPAIFQESNQAGYLHSYVDTYLREEIMQEGLTRNLSAFSRFLEIASFSVGSPINTTAVARDAMIGRKVVDNYFSILQDLMLGYLLPAFTRRAKRKVISHPKFYFFDTGIFQTLRPKGPLDNASEIGGHALENLFFQNLISINDSLSLRYNFYYHQTIGGSEVDFVAYGPRGFFAFEIKHSPHFSPSQLRGLTAFKDEYPEAKLYFIYTGTQKLYVKNTTVLPAHTALLNLPSILATTTRLLTPTY